MGKQSNSLLVADIGSTMTTVTLIDRVNGRYRFVARGESLTTQGWPWSDVTVGVCAAARQIERLVGRALFRGDGTLIRPCTAHGDGVDDLVVVSSAAPAVRAVLVGLTHDVSLRSGYRALTSAAGVHLVDSFALDNGVEWRDPNTWLTALQCARPELVLIVGGCDGGAVQPVLDLIQLVALYNRLLTSAERPLVCYAGNVQLAEVAARAFAGLGELHIMANVRPSPGVEDIVPTALSIEALYQERWLMRVPGMTRMTEWAGEVVPTARSFGQMIHYVGERYALNVVGFDVGSGQTTVASYCGGAFNGAPESQASEGILRLTVRPDLGIGWNIPAALQQITLESISRWLPEEVGAEKIREILLNKSLYPQSAPTETRELLVEYALAREVMRTVWAAHSDATSAKVWDLILGSGRILTRPPAPGHVALLFLDALEPVGVTRLAFDVGNIATALGAMAKRNPLAAADVVEYDAFLTLGTLVATSGRITPGEIAVHVMMERHDGRIVQEAVPGGKLRVIPLPPYRAGTLALHPARGIDVGVGRVGTSAIAEAEGGTLGVLVDTRGRPLSLPTEARTRCQMVRSWLDDVLPKRSSAVQTQGFPERTLYAA